MFRSNSELHSVLAGERTKGRQEVLTLQSPHLPAFCTKDHNKYRGTPVDHCYFKGNCKVSGTLQLPIRQLGLSAVLNVIGQKFFERLGCYMIPKR